MSSHVWLLLCLLLRNEQEYHLLYGYFLPLHLLSAISSTAVKVKQLGYLLQFLLCFKNIWIY